MDDLDRPRWLHRLPFWLIHVAAIVGAIWIGWSWRACAWLVGAYAVRMFAISAGYHRYFAHRSFKTSRTFQFLLGMLGMTAAQQGPLWWAGHHRRHHAYSDQPGDVHSPRQRGLWWAHLGWALSSRWVDTDTERVHDLARYPELRFLERHEALIVIGSGVVLLVVGGPVALVWGHFVSLVASWHITFSVNSFGHAWGRRRYATGDDSRNNPLLALLTLGDGWHNNHHHYQRAARHGFYWWELDVSYYVLKVLELLHIVRDVKGVPRHVRDHRAPAARPLVERAPATAPAP